MEAPRQKFSRLLTALDELVTQEAATLSQHDFAAVTDLQHRADPLVTALAELGPQVLDELARARVAGLLARRQHTIDLLETQLATTREELQAVQSVYGRVAQIAPVYGRAAPPSGGRQFRAAG